MTEVLQYPCPVCGFLVFGEPPGSYDICPICHWEDDSVQLKHPTLAGGANEESLQEYQHRILRVISVAQCEADGYQRHCDWRPLTPEDINAEATSPTTRLQYFEDAAAESPQYYWNKP